MTVQSFLLKTRVVSKWQFFIFSTASSTLQSFGISIPKTVNTQVGTQSPSSSISSPKWSPTSLMNTNLCCIHIQGCVTPRLGHRHYIITNLIKTTNLCCIHIQGCDIPAGTRSPSACCTPCWNSPEQVCGANRNIEIEIFTLLIHAIFIET